MIDTTFGNTARDLLLNKKLEDEIDRAKQAEADIQKKVGLKDVRINNTDQAVEALPNSIAHTIAKYEEDDGEYKYWYTPFASGIQYIDLLNYNVNMSQAEND